jgi:Fic family protein
MIYRDPKLRAEDLAVLERIEQLWTDLRFYLVKPRRWFGSLRRATVARAVQGSNTIEGYHASVEDVAAVLEHEEPLDADLETRHAIAGYRDAMTYVLQLAADPPPVDESFVRSLHFMMMKHDLTKHPGQWRPGPVWIEDGEGTVVYEAPDRDQVDGLMAETLGAINSDTGPVLVRAALAHLNLTLVHPFSDGDGRMARCLQTYVLASAGVVAPEFCSIEEYLGHNTTRYYEVLTEVARGRWSPEHDARPWVRFCLTAHYRQAQTVLRRIHETEALWDRCEQLALAARVPNRCVPILCDAARGWRVRRSLYVKVVRSATGIDVSEVMATRDLRKLVDAGLLEPFGEKRARYYQPTAALRAAWEEIRS